MHALLLLPLIGAAVAAPVASPQIDSLDPHTGKPLNSTSHQPKFSVNAAQASSSWWYPNLDHSTGAVRDYVPYLYSGNTQDYNYPTYIAVNSGDSQGFVNALYSNGPNGDRDNGYISGEPRTVYLAPGTYTLSQTVYLDTDTVIIGDAKNPPTIKAASGFNGDYLLVGGEGGDTGRGGMRCCLLMPVSILTYCFQVKATSPL